MFPPIEEMAIAEGKTLREAVVMIDRNAQGVVFVVDENDRLKGLLTDGDIRRSLLKGNTLRAKVKEVMNKDFTYCHVETPPEKIARFLNEHIRHIPLIDSEGRLMDYACLARLHRIPIAEPDLGGNELNYVVDCVKSNWISSQGKYVDQLERMFEKIFEGRKAIAVTNGTAALHLSLVALGIKTGDEVIVPDLTFAASANAVIHTGAIPVFVDVSFSTWGLDPKEVEKAITPKTKAIMPVHLYGHPCDMDSLLEIAKRRHLLVIEDCAEALGAVYKGRPVGLLGDAACFSFFGNKMITTGEGGMIVFRDDQHAERAKLLRDHGMSKDKRYWHLEVGYNYRITNLQAAVGVAQLEQYKRFVDRKQTIANAYTSALRDCEGVTLPPAGPWAENVFWLYTVLINESIFGKRDELIYKFLLNGIECRPVFYPLHQMPPYAPYCRARQEKNFPISEEISRRGISLPSAVTLTEEEIRKVCRLLYQVKNVKEMKNIVAVRTV